MKNKKLLIDFEHISLKKYIFKWRFTLLFLCLLLFANTWGYSQTGLANLNLKNASVKESTKDKITGKVIDTKGEPVVGATVMEKGTSNGTITDIEGKFSIAVKTNSLLEISYIGYKTLTAKAVVGKSLTLTLTEDTEMLDEVVVVGYGIQKRRDVTGAVTSIRTEQLKDMPQTNISQALQGKIPGLKITNTSSSANGAGAEIQIRGQNSISANSGPLIILDGMPYSDPLSELNPNDIESIEVLKDASSAAIYGARAASGVLLVTTKRGEMGKVQVGYDGYYGLDKMYMPFDLMNAQEFYDLKKERFGLQDFYPSQIENYEKGIDTDWFDLASQLGQRHQHNISVSGGTEATRYYFAGSLGKVKGVAKNDNFDRYTFRINLDSKINSWLRIGTNTQLGYYRANGEKANIQATLKMNPLAIPFNEDGSINFYPISEVTNVVNPLEYLLYQKEVVTRSVITNNYIEITPSFIKGLTYKLNAAYNFRNSLTEGYRGRNTLAGSKDNGRASNSNTYKEGWIVENIINYKHSFGLNNFDLTALYGAERTTNKNHSIDGTGFPSDLLTYYQQKLGTAWSPSDSYSQVSSISQMFRLNYNYNSKYLFTFTLRRDGFSAFGADSKFGLFPSFALGWNMDQEKFIKKIQWLDQLKLRFSYGHNGNQAIGAYSSLAGMANQNYLSDDKKTLIGYYPSKLADPTLSWETTKSFNVGFDFSIFKGRLIGTFDTFFSRTSDLLLNKVIPEINGANNIRQNIGKTKNRGVEFSLSSVNIKNRNFSWMTDLNISHSRNKIVDVGLYESNGKPMDNLGNSWFIGKPINVWYAYVFDGIWQETDDIQNSHMPTAKPGDAKVKDVDGNGSITPEDRQIVGYKDPKWFGGLTNTFKYKNLSLSFLITTVQGVTRKTDYLNTFFGGQDNTIRKEWWTSDNPINTYPANRIDSNPYAIQFYGDVNDASYWRLNDITLSYKLPQNLIQKVGMRNLELYFNAKNTVTITDFIGLDPEISEDYGVPSTRAYIFGLRFNL
ncbi:SusC/RagA family TonB-linked outer membrane protein [Bacteroides intestinalis]|uniref:SusC/RagA family TonB-linked outer membrane protein n=1 Tax=Bacteroides intestinalis TaxID=329854 RepID=UPI000E4966E6|nr:TonB-dependent receptor [Bacteroides intestinalis]RGX87305.1 TonB-dependent receptor [Bacteroides intestinalis]